MERNNLKTFSSKAKKLNKKDGTLKTSKSSRDLFARILLADSNREIDLKLMSLATRYSAARVDFVIDRYPDVSIKNAERSRRAGGDCQVINVHSDNQKTPQQWKKNLSVGRNKKSLLSYLANSWKSFHSSLFKGMTLYITNKESCWKLSPVENSVCSSDIVADLECNHEEADTRLLLHANTHQNYTTVY